jgi:uncharacterized protein (DUF362 family)
MKWVPGWTAANRWKGKFMEKICLIKESISSYPPKEDLFRPGEDFPEYLYKKNITKKDNPVYRMIRAGFEMMEFDQINYGSSEWNPLGEIVNPGDCVLIKPNMVLHENRSGCGTECLFTNPSLVGAVIDYVIIALKGKGKIIVGDAPLQECEFETLIEESGYRQLIDFYIQKGVDISLVDFRNIKTYEKDGVHYLQSEEEKNGVVVSLNEESAFFDVNEKRIQNLRITNYDPRILQGHHKKNMHEYKVSQYVLDADVIINMPKPKTHRKAGVTIALKNLVGINANKEFLPHHTLGSKAEGGDAYLHENLLLKLANEILDIKNQLVHDNEMNLAIEAEKFYHNLYEKGKKQSEEKYWEGSWYGNDTIWRTIADLNRILLYADKTGKMTNSIQRRQFIIGDMIVSGEREGPLEPTPVYPGVIVMGKNPVAFDQMICSLMGFDYQDIPSLSNKALFDSRYPIANGQEIQIRSNCNEWNGKSLEEIREKYSLEFQPTSGWEEKLGNRYRDKLYKKVMSSGGSVYIFGAGANGVYAADELQKHGIKVSGFCDNNEKLWGREIIKDICCISLNQTDLQIPFVIGAQSRRVEEIKKQIVEAGGHVIGVVNQ